jgi:type VI protein secretion system component VasF
MNAEEAKPMSAAQAKNAAERARYDLAETLDAIEDKFDVQKRASELGRRAKESYDRNPIPWIVGGAAAAIIAVGLIAWAILSDDD